ncbi:MAG TPA: TonB-dependent receptor [Bacteroidales bacterium]|nr:TonB-dependent receptor [Bacteroidales bacterium]
MVKKMLLLVTFLAGLVQLYAQDRTITGKIVDEAGNILPGATVTLKGTTKVTVTDLNGVYSLSAPQEGGTLVVSYVGYTSQEVQIGESNTVDINLQPDIQALNEVVVVGYGVQKKSLVTGSIAKVKAEDLANQPALRVEQALQGKTSGVIFNQTSGNPGAQVTVRIRGVSSNGKSEPLFIIDGMKTSKFVMNEIDPADIESVEVLKDAASAAIYGSEGANGVIIITTKSGAGNKEKVTVTYDGYYGWQVADPVAVMSTAQYKDYFREAYAYDKSIEASNSIKSFALPAFVEKVSYWTDAADSLIFKYNTPAYQYERVRSIAEPALQKALTNQQTLLSNGSITQKQYDNNVKAINNKLEALANLRPLTFEQYKANLFNKKLNSPTDKAYANIRDNVDTTSNGTNWMDEIFQVAPMQKHHISVQASSEKANLYLSASYFTQDGVVGGAKNNFTRYNFRLNGDVQATKWMKLGSNVTVAQSKSRNLPLNDLYGGIISAAMSHDPTIVPYWNDTSEVFAYYRSVGRNYTTEAAREDLLNNRLLKTEDGRYYSNTTMPVNERVNPLAIMQLSQNDVATTERVIGNAYSEIKPFKFLTYRLSFSGELTYVTNDNWGPAYKLNDTRQRDYSYVYKQIARYYNSQIDNTLSFVKSFGDHNVSATVGQSAEQYIGYSVNGTRINLQELNESWNYLDAVQRPDTLSKLRDDNGGFKDKNTKMAYFGRVNYDFREKYMFGATIRRDGSSLFSDKKRWGVFPSFSLGWNVHKESFFNVPFVSLMKVRGSWGRNGSTQNVDAYMWISTKTAQSLGGAKTIVTGVTKNEDLKWETSEQTDIGVDFGFLKNKLTLTIDWYNKKTIDLLAKPILPAWMASSSGDVAYYNVGEVSNKGLEFDLGYSDNIADFKYDAKLTATYLKNEVTDFNAQRLTGYGAHGAPFEATAFEEGQPVWYFRGYKAEGIFQSWEEIRNYTYTDPNTGVVTLIQPDAVPGDVKIKDVGGTVDPKTGKASIPDGKIDGNDYTYVGKPMPSWTFGLNLNGEYKGFDLSMFWYAEVDKEIYNNTLRGDFLHLNRAETFYTNRWTEGSGTNDWMRARYTDNTTGSTQIGFNSLFFEDGSFLRLKNIQLGYTLPVSLTQKVQISKLRFYVSASNLLTFTNYTGSDPEIGYTGDNNSKNHNSFGVDRGMYPSAKQYIIGVNITF